MRCQLMPIRIVIIKKNTNNKCGEDGEKGEPLYTVRRNLN